MSTLDPTSTQSEATLHPIACIACRKSHKKCDRLKPSCTKCQQRGIQCEYRNPGKKGRIPLDPEAKKFKLFLLQQTNQQETNQYKPYPIGGSETSSEQKHLDRTKVLDLFYNIFGLTNPVIERKQFEQLLSDGKDDVKTMYLAIRAMCEQHVGLNELAEDSIKQTRSRLTSSFDQYSNFYIVCAYLFMSLYESGCGRMKTARFYIRSVDFYFEEMSIEESMALTTYQINLRKLLAMAQVWIGNGDHLAMLKEWSLLLEKHGIQVPTECRTLLEQDVSIENYIAILKTVELLVELSYQKYQSSSPKSEKFFDLFKLAQPIIISSFRIAILSHVNRSRNIVESNALRVTQSTQHELFNMMPPVVVSHIVLASRVHLDICRSIQRGERENPVLMEVPITSIFGDNATTLELTDYFQVLEKDFRALRILSIRFKKVSLLYGDLMEEIEQVLYEHNGGGNNDDEDDIMATNATTMNNATTTDDLVESGDWFENFEKDTASLAAGDSFFESFFDDEDNLL